MELEKLVEQNPWWRHPNRIQSDPKIRDVDSSKIKWIPRLKFALDMNKNLIYTLRGPRQVGKTTLLKIFIKELLDMGVNPKSIFYFTCDLINNGNEY